MQLSLDIFEDSFTVGVSRQLASPIEMTLLEFLSTPEWNAYPDPHGSGESKGMYKLQRPDGTDWIGYIGKFRSEESAKRHFHQHQVLYAVHQGKDVSERVLKDYPEVQNAQQEIVYLQNRIQIRQGPYARLNVTGHDRYFHIYDFPMWSRVNTRGFVRNHQLYTPKPEADPKIHFTPIETASIAVYKALKGTLDENYRPNLQVPEYNKLLWCWVKKEVKFRIPQEIADGYLVNYSEYEGETVDAPGWTVPRISFFHQGEKRYWPLHPSQLIAVREQGGKWKEIKQRDEH